MRVIRHTLIESVHAPCEQVFAILADPARMPQWLPGCTAVETDGPLHRGTRLVVHFGERLTEFEITDLNPPATVVWEERGGRNGSKTLIQLDAVRGSTRITVRHVWAPVSFLAWWRGRVLVKRRVERTLRGILRGLRNGTIVQAMNRVRLAQPNDVADLQALIARSARGLSVGYYTPAQTEAAVRYVFGVDSQLIADRTYFVIENEGRVVACGGWSRRRTLFGGDQAKAGPDPLLDPATEPARIRAFFVDPQMARRGLGRLLMSECISAARAAGFGALELVSTLPGEPLYLATGFSVIERFDLALPGDVLVPVTKMRLTL
ncbi:MAG TPA: GNAT family N-acetyltransferase [Gemmatimonadales bacterium]|nr:GNAT family N-acetyltransferase [Gemmatimonadales bacterium]